MTSGLLGVGLALASAGCYDAGYLLEKGAISRVPSLTAHRGATRVLIGSRRWLLGATAMLSGLALRFVALTVAPVAVVQPILVGGTVAIVPAARLMLGERVAGREAAAVGALTVGVIAVALGAAQADAGGGRPGNGVALTVMVAVALALVVGMRGGFSETRSRAAGVVCVALCYGTGAIAEKGVAVQVSAHGVFPGVRASLVTVDPWLFVAATAAGLVLFQVALQRQPVSVLVPATNGLSSAWAVAGAAVVFAERWPHQGPARAALACGYVALAAGVVVLHRVGADDRAALGGRRPAPSPP
ncbi:hypothetical protein K6U06_00975 [Acidiferrimicrobium sp. IK]|uniref:hypothetical protein n=1 Tax=Acidiferrimicrobium sp. IK TaxID=2871700 RepID=UPI0021CB431D|nr:hypothetical protein [Acidiferrimicrobium sp. IK]MCU4182920.1 hypothetical protein [Acidiferrimicrobium sp. IK]